jgi:hypothetical protein
MFVAEVFCEKKIVLKMPDLSFFLQLETDHRSGHCLVDHETREIPFCQNLNSYNSWSLEAKWTSISTL